ncbi:MAG: hypothetical protein IJ912_04805 [Fibrobacter sp.]|nr:hypothetical protein [Fibrobacter sp.]MBR6834132.1 hypothetical protein [Fibrobacter sp.]
MKNKLGKITALAAVSMALVVTGCSSESSSVAGEDSEEYIEDVESGGDEGTSSSSIAGKDKKGKSSSSEKADSSSVEEYAIKNMTLTGVAQKGPFVDGTVWMAEVDCNTLKWVDEFSRSVDIQTDNGEYKIEDISFSTPCAIIWVRGHYLDEHAGEKSKKEVELEAFVNLTEHDAVNINVFTELEYKRMKYLVNQKGMTVAKAKEQAKKEVLAAFGIKDGVGDFVDLNILKPGDGNAALLAASVLLTAQTDLEKNAHLIYRVDDMKESFVETGVWDDEIKTDIANWAHSAKEKDLLEKVRKNVAKYTDEVPDFEKYVETYAEAFYDPEKDKSSSETPVHTKEWQELHDVIYHFVLEENTPETLKEDSEHRVYRDDEETNAGEYLMDKKLYHEMYDHEGGEALQRRLIEDGLVWDGDEWDDERYPGVHYEVWMDTLLFGNGDMHLGYKVRFTLGEGADAVGQEIYLIVAVKTNRDGKPYIPPKKEDD